MKQVLLITIAALSFLTTSTSMAADIAEIYGESTSFAVRGTLTIPISPTISTLELGDRKIVEAAHEDALYYVGSQGVETPAKLQQAFNVIRKARPAYNSASDLQLAEDIANGEIN